MHRDDHRNLSVAVNLSSEQRKCKGLQKEIAELAQALYDKIDRVRADGYEVDVQTMESQAMGSPSPNTLVSVEVSRRFFVTSQRNEVEGL